MKRLLCDIQFMKHHLRLGSIFGLTVVFLCLTILPTSSQILLRDFDTVLGYFHPDVLSKAEFLSSEVIERLGPVASSLQAAAANEIANLSISAGGTQYFFGRDRMFYNSGNLGTFFIEPPWTHGEGNGSIGINTSYLNFQTFQGQRLGEIFDFYDSDTGVKLWEGDYDLVGQLTSLSLSYGMTEKLDLGVILPFVYLEGEGSTEFADIQMDSPIVDFSESATELADIILRAKYELIEVEDLDELLTWSIGLDLKLNNGDRDHLLGTGDLGCRIRTSIGKRFDFAYPVIELAYNFAGVNAQESMIVRNLNGDINRISTGIKDEDFNALEIRCGLPIVLIHDRWNINLEWIYSSSNFATTNDIGLSTRTKITSSFYLQGGVRIPLDDDGLRSDFVPTIGIEYRF